MQLTWSHKLFFYINRIAGHHPVIDRVAVICAKYIIFLMGWLVLFIVNIYEPHHILFILTLASAVALALIISWLLAWLWPHPRPSRQFPEVKELFTPLSHWKSFPSDHTVVAFVMAEMVWYVSSAGDNQWLVFTKITLFVLAGLIAAARVYTGVHYPKDIVGGAILATVVVALFRLFF